jgi:IS5 family transposase
MIKGLFDIEFRMEDLTRNGDPLVRLNACVDWEMFRPELETIREKERKSPAGRKPFDVVLMFKIVVLQRYYNLSDEQAEFQINDRLSFQKFLGMTLADTVPDQKTIWLFREQLGRGDGVKKLFKRFDHHLASRGLIGKAGKIIDASFVDVPRQRNSRADNETIKNGEVPESFTKNENVREQKDVDARWTKKNKEVHYGYKDHVKADAQTKLIEEYVVTDASVHDSQAVKELVEEGDGQLWADSAYTGKPVEGVLGEKNIASKIHEKGYRNRPLTEEQKLSNRAKSTIRVRIEHIFGHMTNSMRDGLKIRFIGMRRMTAGIGLLNLVYNLARYEQIARLQLA